MKSDYTFHTRESQGVTVLVIIDLDQGGMSVTNNAEAIVMSIASKLGTGIYRKPIIYRDSDGTYDGIDGTYLPDPFYHIGTQSESDAAYQAASRYWDENRITFIRDRAYKRSTGGNADIKVPERLAEIQATWADWQNEYGDKGSCVLGAGFEFDYEGQRYMMPPAGRWQGSCSWEASRDKVEELLTEAGAENIRYHWGHMD